MRAWLFLLLTGCSSAHYTYMARDAAPAELIVERDAAPAAPEDSAAPDASEASAALDAVSEAETGPAYYLGSPCAVGTNDGVMGCQSAGMQCWAEPTSPSYGHCAFSCVDPNNSANNYALQQWCASLGGTCAGNICIPKPDGG